MRPKYNRIAKLIWSAIICCVCIILLVILMIMAILLWYAWFYFAGPVCFLPFSAISLLIAIFLAKIIRWVYKWNKES